MSMSSLDPAYWRSLHLLSHASSITRKDTEKKFPSLDTEEANVILGSIISHCSGNEPERRNEVQTQESGGN